MLLKHTGAPHHYLLLADSAQQSVSTRFGFLIETKCVPMILLSEREQFGHRTFGLA